MSEWLDLELAHELSPVAAPEGLWTRVQTARHPHSAPKRRHWNLRLPILAATALLIATGALWSGHRSSGLDSLAVRELANAAPLSLHSTDAAEIRTWLHQRTNVDVPIAASPKVRLKGARVIEDRGALIGEVAYEVPGGNALLLVARATGDLRSSARHGARTWQQGQQVYAVICDVPGQPDAACALCHASL